MKHIESRHSVCLFRWAQAQRSRLPELDLLVHVPNGGVRSQREAARMKREGVRAGFPDYILPARASGYVGAAFEMKAGNNYPTASQREWFDKLRGQGWLTFCAWDWLECARLLERYLLDELRDVDLSPGQRFGHIRTY